MQPHTSKRVTRCIFKVLSLVDFLKKKTFWAKWHTFVASIIFYEKVKLNLVVLVRERTIPTEKVNKKLIFFTNASSGFYVCNLSRSTVSGTHIVISNVFLV
jgi:hypothetical protein